MEQVMKRLCMVAMLASAAFAGGCNSMNTIEPEQQQAVVSPLATKVIRSDYGLADVTRVVDVRQSVVSGDLLRVDVSVYNNRFTQARFDYAFEWFDDRGMKIDTPLSAYRKQIIEAKERVVLTGIAPDPRAKDFRLKLSKNKQ
jgi:uncharacterized protein YcfL